MATVGGQENAFTSSDYTGYFQRVSREHLKTLMEFEADRMTGLVLTDEAVAPELNVVLEEQNQRVANNPRARLSEQIDAALYLNHPYGRPVIGWRHEIEKLNREDALAFYKRFYTPNNAVLVVAGDVTADEVKTLAEETYGKVAKRRRDRPARAGRRSRRRSPPRHVTLADPRVTAAEPAAQLSRASDDDRQARRIRGARSAVASSSAAAPTAGSTARWWSSSALAISAGAWYSRHRARRHALRRLRHAASPASRLPKLEDAIDAVIDDVVDKGVTADELERAKNRLIADAVYAQDSQATMARWYGAALTTGSTVEAVQTWPDRLRAVTADAVERRGKGLARQAPVGDRLSRQGRAAERRNARDPASGVACIAAAAASDRSLLAAQPAGATKIERVVSPGGIEAWLVREPSLPLVALNFAFAGGASQDPADKPGVGYMVVVAARRRRRRSRRQGVPAAARRATPSNCASRSTRDHFRGSLRTAEGPPGAELRPAAACAQRSRASMPTPSSACASRCCPACGARPPSPNEHRQPGVVGHRLSQTIPMAVRPTAR